MKFRKTFLFFVFIALFFCTNLACSEDSKDVPVAKNNKIENAIIPMSKAMIPDNIKEKAENNTKYILKFFNTPEQQMLPLGIYAMVEDMRNVRVLKELRSNHINFVHKYFSAQTLESALKDLAAAREAGMPVMLHLPKKKIREGRAYWENLISGLVDDQQLLLWYLPEEIGLDKVSYIKPIAKMIEQKDKFNRPLITYLDNYVEGYWESVSEITDALIFGLYPILYSDCPRINCKRVIDKAYQVGVPVVFKSVEAYQYKGRWTTPKEVRCDTYLALISGTKGIIWYCYAQARNNQKLMNELYKLGEELNGEKRLGEVILTGDKNVDITCRLLKGDKYSPPATAFENRNRKIKRLYASLQWTARKYKNSLYIFAVNVNQKVDKNDHGGEEYAVEVSFESKDFSDGDVTLISEGRILEIQKNKFKDKFFPLETHIYKVELKNQER